VPRDGGSFELGEAVSCCVEEVVVGRVDMKELTLLEKVLVQLLVQWMNSFGFSRDKEYQVGVLMRAGLTKQQALKVMAPKSASSFSDKQWNRT